MCSRYQTCGATRAIANFLLSAGTYVMIVCIAPVKYFSSQECVFRCLMTLHFQVMTFATKCSVDALHVWPSGLSSSSPCQMLSLITESAMLAASTDLGLPSVRSAPVEHSQLPTHRNPETAQRLFAPVLAGLVGQAAASRRSTNQQPTSFKQTAPYYRAARRVVSAQAAREDFTTTIAELSTCWNRYQ